MIPVPALLMNKYLWAAVGAAVAVLAAVIWHNAKVSAAEDRGYERGLRDERLVWQVRENHELNAANVEITRLQNAYRALEKKSVDDVAAVAFEFQTLLKKVRNEKDAAIASADSYRLRWTTGCTASQGSGGNSSPGAGSAPSTTIGTATCELPEQTRKDLIELASDADLAVAERNALLTIAQKDREVCK
jgi:hypothetical protein